MDSTISEAPQGSLAARIAQDIAVLDRELVEIDVLVEQVRAESGRHEQRRVQAAERLSSPERSGDPQAMAEAYARLATITRRAAVMEAQVDVLEGKRKILARHRDAFNAILESLAGMPAGLLPEAGTASASAGSTEPSSPGLSRVVIGAQEDLRREIARAIHDGPAQSLTNIVLQAQIVERLVRRGHGDALGELRQLVSMVQHTLDATKRFIFDVRPMVLDDLGLMATLRRAVRERGRRGQVPVTFESAGADRRLPMELESALFRILDAALAAYVSMGPEQVALVMDWQPDALEVRITAAGQAPPAAQDEPAHPRDLPPALQDMVDEQRSSQAARAAAARAAALPSLPPGIARDILDRAASVGANVQVLAEGTELRVAVALPPEPG